MRYYRRSKRSPSNKNKQNTGFHYWSQLLIHERVTIFSSTYMIAQGGTTLHCTTNEFCPNSGKVLPFEAKIVT